MSTARWLSTTVAMCGVAWALHVLTPQPTALPAALADPQHLVDTAGPDALLLAVAGALAWLVWSWGAVGLLLTAASALPGWTGALAGLLVRAVVPAAARRAAAVAVGLSVTAGVASALPPPTPPLATASASTPAAPAVLPDWPVSGTGAALDWPAGTTTPPGDSADWPTAAAGEHVVVRGDCLWDVARDWLTAQGRPARDADVAAAVTDWWQANAEVIGPDPDLLLPGQVLRPPR